MKLERLNASATVIYTQGKELLFSYTTLVGVAKDGVCYFHREGKAASVTTAKHIGLWTAGRERHERAQDAIETFSEGV